VQGVRTLRSPEAGQDRQSSRMKGGGRSESLGDIAPEDLRGEK
jgi:hypothetical protein